MNKTEKFLTELEGDLLKQITKDQKELGENIDYDLLYTYIDGRDYISAANYVQEQQENKDWGFIYILGLGFLSSMPIIGQNVGLGDVSIINPKLTTSYSNYLAAYQAEYIKQNITSFYNSVRTLNRDRVTQNILLLSMFSSPDAIKRMQQFLFEAEIQELPNKKIKSLIAGKLTKENKKRNELISVTEITKMFGIAQDKYLQEKINSGKIESESVLKFWETQQDERVRNSHRQIPDMNKKGVPYGEDFKTPLGPLEFPGDPKGLPQNIINCRCRIRIEIKED